MKIRKNDTVLVIAGKDRGKRGKVQYQDLNLTDDYLGWRIMVMKCPFRKILTDTSF